MTEPVEPLEPKLRALLARERRAAKMTSTEAQGLDARLAATLGPAVVVGAAGAAIGVVSGTGAGVTTTAATTSSAMMSSIAIKTALVVAGATFVVGIGTGVGLHRVLEQPRVVERRVEVVRVVQVRAPAARVETATPSPAPLASPLPEPSFAPARPTPPPASDSSRSSLDVETHALDRARTALARGRPIDALHALDEHRHRFPHGQLAEERDALRVQALVATGRHDEAVGAAQSFRAQHPNSVFQRVVDSALTPR